MIFQLISIIFNTKSIFVLKLKITQSVIIYYNIGHERERERERERQIKFWKKKMSYY